MNNDGYTLIELLAIIVILSTVAVISFIAFSGVLTRAREDSLVFTDARITDAGQMYVLDNPDIQFPVTYTVADFIRKGYLRRDFEYWLRNEHDRNPNQCNIVITSDVNIQMECN